MKLFKTSKGAVVESGGQHYLLNDDWDALFNRPGLLAGLNRQLPELQKAPSDWRSSLLAPIGSQEVWGAGVTYFRSRDARMEESQQAGGGDFYARVYEAQRPELFFKAPAYRVVGSGQQVRIRRDSKLNVPEPELTLAVNAAGEIIGYTIGNDMSSRDIEGENPLYLPQAKTYDQSCALGPCILLTSEALPKTTPIKVDVTRKNVLVFNGSTTLAQLKREPVSLVEFLYRESTFPTGCFLLTGTGVIPPISFTLQPGDLISITIDGIGELQNTVMQRA